jgi:hypothetical protein
VSALSLALLCLAISFVAFLYSSVGHAGASGYIAVMTLAGIPATTIKPAALVLNIAVACLASWQFWRAGHFSWRLFWPFAALSIPCAFLGGYLTLPAHILKTLIGLVLLYSAARFLISRKEPASETYTAPSLPAAASAGAGIGLLSGLTGTGGGIFLTPLIIFLRWAGTKTASAISALFILVNSISGLLGNLTSTKELPFFALPVVGAAILGGSIGSYLGSRQFSPDVIKRLLAIVLLIAGLKLIFT